MRWRPPGIDGIVNRRHLEAGPRLLRQVAVRLSVVGLGMAVIGLLGYDMSPALAAMLFVSSATGGRDDGGRRPRFRASSVSASSLALMQSPNIVLMLAAAWRRSRGRVTERGCRC